MKYLNSYKLYEYVIVPDEISNDIDIKGMEDLVEYGRINDFDVVSYDEFYNSLNETDKKTAPPKHGVPYFALYHVDRNRAMFVVCNIHRIDNNIKPIIKDIIGHERIHSKQSGRRREGSVYKLPNPNNRKDYFSNKDEVMAFSWTIANDLSKHSKNIEEAISLLKSKRGFGVSSSIWNAVVNSCDSKTINRYNKYIYMYLLEIFNKNK